MQMLLLPQFKDMKNGQYKMISFYAKKARGMMARFIIQNRIQSVNDILSFNLGGYNYMHLYPYLINPYLHDLSPNI